jgi:hypothetical protein
VKYLNLHKKDDKAKNNPLTPTDNGNNNNSRLAAGIIAADLPGLDEINCPSLKVVNLVVQPSLLAENETKEIYAKLSHIDPNSRLYVIVNGADREFVQFADTLQKAGAECTGYLPEFRGSTYFIFSDSKKLSSLRSLSLESLIAKNISKNNRENVAAKLATANNRVKTNVEKNQRGGSRSLKKG